MSELKMMKQGKTLTELAIELDRQEKSKRDFLADTRSMHVESREDGKSYMQLDSSFTEEFMINDLAHRQISQRLDIPAKYYDRLRAEHPALLDRNINTLFQEKPEKRMLRTLDGNARAFLSDRYRPLDNFDLAQAVIPIIGEVPDMKPISCELTERRMYIKALFPRTEREVGKGDVVQSGIVISNSEVGHGALSVEPLVFRLACLNGMISRDYGQRKNHVGRVSGDEDSYEIFRDETLKADDRAVWMKIQDLVRASIDDAKFKMIVDKMAEAMNVRIEADPVKVVEKLGKAYQMSENETGGVLRHLIEGGDLSMYGMMNAVTATSKEIQSYDRATEFERLGGKIIELNQTEWRKIAA